MQAMDAGRSSPWVMSLAEAPFKHRKFLIFPAALWASTGNSIMPMFFPELYISQYNYHVDIYCFPCEIRKGGHSTEKTLHIMKYSVNRATAFLSPILSLQKIVKGMGYIVKFQLTEVSYNNTKHFYPHLHIHYRHIRVKTNYIHIRVKTIHFFLIFLFRLNQH